MTPTSDGNWYAYVADTSEVGDIVADFTFDQTMHNNNNELIDTDDSTEVNTGHVTNVNTSYNPGINFGAVDNCSDDSVIDNNNAAEIYCADDDNAVNTDANFVVGSPKTGATGANTNWPFIQTYEFADTIEIQYNKGRRYSNSNT